MGEIYEEHDETMHTEAKAPSSQSTKPAPRTYKLNILWHYVIWFIFAHIVFVYGIYLIICGRILFKTFLFTYVLAFFSGLGVTAGAHRLWSHRSYKARLPLRVLLAALFTVTFQRSLTRWVKEHRVHHKYTDTDADPYNAKRGFFFSHIGWIFLRMHPDAVAKCEEICMTDVTADPVVEWQGKYYLFLMPLLTFLLPSMIPYWFWKENFLYSFVIAGMCRYGLVLHITFSVNSFAHIWGMKPYDKNISPVENPTVAFMTSGEGWHNYHHTFPWDYKAAELGNYMFNLTTAFIDFCALLGLAYDLKTADGNLVAKRSKRTGERHVK